MSITDTTEFVIQTVNLGCGHQFRYRIGRGVAESGFARPGVAWRCAQCDPTGDIKRPITTVDNAPAEADS